MNPEPNLRTDEQEIDLIDLIRQLWHKRRLIGAMTAGFLLAGIAAALFSPKVYTATCTFVPQSGKRSSGNVSSLAALAGIPVGRMNSGEESLSPSVYPNILSSNPFRLELLETPVSIDEADHPITLKEYLTDPAYRSFSLTGTIAKYTLGLPGLIYGALRGNASQKTPSDTVSDDKIIVLDPTEKEAIGRIAPLVTISMNSKEGYITVAAHMPEPYAAAQVAQRATALLQEYVTEFKIEKLKANLAFIRERYAATKADYEAIQARRAAYMDSNQRLSTYRARMELEQLDNQYDLAFSIYSELAKQLEQAKISVCENTPIFTIVDPVTVPFARSKPRRALIVFGFALFGFIAGCGIVFLTPFIKTVTAERDDRSAA